MIVPNQRPNAPKGRSLKSALNNQEQQQPIFTTIREDKGGGVVPYYNSNSYQDEYSKYDPEPDADQLLINSGATIIHSELEINGRLIVRPNYDNEYY